MAATVGLGKACPVMNTFKQPLVMLCWEREFASPRLQCRIVTIQDVQVILQSHPTLVQVCPLPRILMCTIRKLGFQNWFHNVERVDESFRWVTAVVAHQLLEMEHIHCFHCCNLQTP